ncbi:DeoR/GlpR family DNA-binding transcription regulator [Intrasporangium sp. DVR]
MRSVASQTARARRDEIVRLATTTGLASVEELSTLLGVTASTIRRDLAKLTGQGKLARTYGGAMSLAHHPEAPLRQRLGEAYSAKHAIARWAASQVQSGETILLDAGSTAGALAEELRGVPRVTELTVVTAGLTAMANLAEVEGIDVIALGGRLRPLSQAFVGPLTEAAVSRISFDRAFMGADGVHADRGICEASLDQTRLKELMMGRAEQTYVLAHGAKLGQAPFHAWAVMPARWTLVTDESADPRQLGLFRDRGVKVVVAPS